MLLVSWGKLIGIISKIMHKAKDAHFVFSSTMSITTVFGCAQLIKKGFLWGIR
jgi:hypothetical protein